MTRAVPGWARLCTGALVVAIVAWRVGPHPFLRGLRAVDGWSIAAAVGIAVVTTVCAAWRWSVVAGRLGLRVPLPSAVAAYYRAQFLNIALPGGVLGDVHRATRHGRTVGDVGRSARAVVWERVGGQVVQVVFALFVLAALPSPVHDSMAIVGALVLAGVAGVAVAGFAAARSRWQRMSAAARAVGADLHRALLSDQAWLRVLFASAVVVAGHAATFVIAARAAGTPVAAVRLLPLAMLVLLAMALPMNIGGWGPREGVAAWLFAAAGLGAGQGVTVATTYGVLALVATLPGAVVLLGGIRD